MPEWYVFSQAVFETQCFLLMVNGPRIQRLKAPQKHKVAWRFSRAAGVLSLSTRSITVFAACQLYLNEHPSLPPWFVCPPEEFLLQRSATVNPSGSICCSLSKHNSSYNNTIETTATTTTTTRTVPSAKATLKRRKSAAHHS